ncbi:hypothetical protein LOK49_LG07G03090 [Camellia lanceoleosa]|uniref:Uncharacterized protein n=1 Tax=Camellia lanceoleosa TaxID=1840588 RepID=A0ACC0H4M1_9ERIC|nr:hypothetical protein LOK49_LG07G03090 [Camellia lanceoleosa]
MPFSHLRLSVPSLPINHLHNTPLSPLLYDIVYCTKFQASTKQSSYRASLVKNKYPSFGLVSSSTTVHAARALNVVDIKETFDLGECCELKLSIISCEEQTLTDKVQLDSCSNSAESVIDDDQKESHRRRKIGQANKGRVPWNKGKKHSAETRERIRQRTKEAMMDPKVRKKMSECPRTLSEQTKAKIRSSLKQLWGERLKWKKSKAKFLSSWAESIAEAAKKGGSDEQELQWDSYDKIKEEIAFQQRQWAAHQAKAKEMEKIRAAQAKIVKMGRLAQKRKEQEQQAKARAEMKRETHRKSEEEKEELAIAQGLKLKERLTKIHKRKSLTNGQITCEDQRAWEKLDLEFIKREHTRREVSLADQIQAARNKRVECGARESLQTSSSLYSSSEGSAG